MSSETNALPDNLAGLAAARARLSKAAGNAPTVVVANPLSGSTDLVQAVSSRNLLGLRRPSTVTTEGFTTFTAGLNLGWVEELQSRRFRQAVIAECNATMAFVAIGVASVVYTNDQKIITGKICAENSTVTGACITDGSIYSESIPGSNFTLPSYSQTNPPFGIKYGALGVPLLNHDHMLAISNGSQPLSLFTKGILEITYDMPRQLNIAFCFGLMIGVLVFSTGSISGGNLNPAVTFSLALTHKMSYFRASCYVAAQCIGAACGALMIRALSPEIYASSGGGANQINYDKDSVSLWTAAGGEMLCTGLLVFVVCAAADAGREKNNKYQGALTPLAISFAVLVAHLILIPIDGCSINPARTFGAAVASGNFSDHWIFWAGPLIGGSAAALIYENLFRLYPNFTPPGTMSASTRDLISSNIRSQPQAFNSDGSTPQIGPVKAITDPTIMSLGPTAQDYAVGAPPLLASAGMASQVVATDATGAPLLNMLKSNTVGQDSAAAVSYAATNPSNAPSLASRDRASRVQNALGMSRMMGSAGVGAVKSDLGAAYESAGAWR
jgi:MIP family channel proteins